MLTKDSLKDILTGHRIYKQYVSYWNFLMQSYEGGVDYTNAFISAQSASPGLLDSLFRIFVNGTEVNQTPQGNLFMHPKERTKDYAERVKMSYYYNFCAPIIDIYVNHLFKQSAIRKLENIKDEVDQVSEDIDCQGSSIDEFRRNLSSVAQVYGHCYVIVDSPNLNTNDILSKRDQIENRAFPYLSIYAPQNVINWSLDKFGNPYWVLVRESDDVNIDPFKYDKNKKNQSLYRLWTRDVWFLYDGDGNEIGSGAHNLGIVPIVCVFDKRSKNITNFLGVSSLSDIAFIVRDIYNSCSELKQILRDQTFAFLAIQGSSDEYSELSVGTCKALLYPEGRQLPAYISPPSTNAEVYFNHIDRQVSKIYQLAKLEGGSANFKGQNAIEQSGVSKAWDFNETNSSLTEKSNNMEDAEMKIWRIYGLWIGVDFDGTVQYPKEFSVSKLSDDMNEAEQSAKLSLGNTFQLEVLKTIQKKKFPSATEQDLEKMAKEAEAQLIANQQNNQQNNQQPMNGNLRSRFPGLFNANPAEKGGGNV